MTPFKGAVQMAIDFEQKVMDCPTRLLRGLVRGSDPIESQRAAVRALDHQTAIQRTILTILASEGPMTAKELEGRIEFRGLAPSTTRKRVSELLAAKSIRQVVIEDRPQRREGCAVYDIAPCAAVEPSV